MASSAEDYPPYLKKVLRTFQSAAMKSLHGPASTVEAWRHEDARPLCLVREETAQSVPVMSTPDPSVGVRMETILENEMITCFRVGGEDRLVVPHVFATVLREFPIVRINAAIDELQIYFSRCNREQLNELKAAGVIPATTATCGLITKTDAERLCAVLLHASPEKFDSSVPKMERPEKAGIPVRHGCFGKAKGVLYPQLYATPEAKCVECADCGGVLSLRQFVSHAHRAKENRTVHWGFSSDMWRVYLRGEEDSKEEELEEIKNRFSASTCAAATTATALTTPVVTKKRKCVVEEPAAAVGAEEVNEVAGEVKRIKREPQDDNDEDVDNEGERDCRERGDPTVLRTGNSSGTPPPVLPRGAPTPSTVGVARPYIYPPPPPFYVGHHPHHHIPHPPPAHHLPPLPHPPPPPPPPPPADPGWLYTMWYNAYAASYFSSTTAAPPHHYYATPSAAPPPTPVPWSWSSTLKMTEMVRTALVSAGLPVDVAVVEKFAAFLEEARHEAYASVQKELHQLKQQMAELRERNAQLEEKLRMSSAAL